jgi:hypothetical protein
MDQRRQVYLEGQASQRAQHVYSARRETEVWHQVAIEHVQVDEVETRLLDARYLIREPPVVAVE